MALLFMIGFLFRKVTPDFCAFLCKVFQDAFRGRVFRTDIITENKYRRSKTQAALQEYKKECFYEFYPVHIRGAKIEEKATFPVKKMLTSDEGTRRPAGSSLVLIGYPLLRAPPPGIIFLGFAQASNRPAGAYRGVEALL